VQSEIGPSSGSHISGFRKKRVQGLGASTHEVTKCETRGGKSESLNQEQEDRWIRTPWRYRISEFGGSEVGRGHFRP
jgi:hypothetical protein